VRRHLSALLCALALTWNPSAMAMPRALLQGKGVVLGEQAVTVKLHLTRNGSIAALQACRSASMVIEGIRSEAEPGVGWDLFLTHPGNKAPFQPSHDGYFASLNFFGMSRVGRVGRKVSFPLTIDLRVILGTAVQQAAPLELHLVPTKRPAAGSLPSIGLVTLWCME
jgi:hypothetical protein